MTIFIYLIIRNFWDFHKRKVVQFYQNNSYCHLRSLYLLFRKRLSIPTVTVASAQGDRAKRRKLCPNRSTGRSIGFALIERENTDALQLKSNVIGSNMLEIRTQETPESYTQLNYCYGKISSSRQSLVKNSVIFIKLHSFVWAPGESST